MSMIMSLFMSLHVNITLRLVSEIINYSCEEKKKKKSEQTYCRQAF